MPESRGGGTSGRDGRPSSAWMGTEEKSSSWRMEGAEAKEEGSSGKSPDIPDVDLKEQKAAAVSPNYTDYTGYTSLFKDQNTTQLDS